MIHNYIFDFGRVLVDFDPLYMTAAYVKDPGQIERLASVIFDRLYWDPLDAGAITDAQIKEDFAWRLPAELLDTACRIYDNWQANLPPIPGMQALVEKLKAEGAGLYLLSNISVGFAEKYKQVPQLVQLFSLFDGLVFSGPLGIVKPSRQIFEYLLQTYDLQPAETVFIDDSPVNVAGAEALGIHGCLFAGDARRLEQQLRAL